MAIDPRTPVVIGVGQFLNRVDQGAEPQSPHELMVEALRRAEADAGAPGAAARAEVVAAVPVISWRYRDPARLVAEAVGADRAATWYPTVGGNTPQLLVNKLAGAISAGDVDLGVVVGGEAYRTRMDARRNDRPLDWPKQDESVDPSWNDGQPFLMGHPAEQARGIFMPTQAYPLFENALWHESGRTLEQHLAHVGRIWSGFSQVAAANPYAWRREAYTADEITTPTPENRLVGFPYTKRMVSNPDVDMSSAVIVCSADRAAALGVPKDRWVFVHAGTDGKDRSMSERRDFVSSPAIGTAGNLALELADVRVEELGHLDLYSCFPSAVQLAVKELGVDDTLPLTVYGGLGFAGGPWNNPVGHAIASMVDVLRDDAGSVGLVTANGGHVDKHSFGVYSTTPPADGFRHAAPQDQIDAVPGTGVEEDYQGPATVETWTVMYGRDRAPERAHAAVRTPAGTRAWAVSDDAELMARSASDDLVGTEVSVGADGAMTFA